MRAARHHLEQGEAGVEEVGHAVGYDDAAFFRRLFKRETGLTPSAYRKQFAVHPIPARVHPAERWGCPSVRFDRRECQFRHQGELAMWNPVAPDVVENPFPFWHWLRANAPVWQVPDSGHFLVARHEQILEVCRDPETYSSELRAVIQRDDAGHARLLRTQLVGQPQARVLGVADGEIHASHRRVVGRTFSPSRMERMSQLALEIAERCVRAFPSSNEVDVIEALAIPLPLELTTRLLGLPLDDRPVLQAWTDHALRMMGGLATAAELAESLGETTRLHAYLAERFDEALAAPADNVMGDLARAVRIGARSEGGLEQWEATAVLFQLVVGGIETTVGLIGAAIRHAAELPGAWSKLRENPALLPAFVEESIRLDGPAIGNPRVTTRDTALGGVALPEGSTLVLLWGSANRDEAQFPEPDRFELDRPNIKAHLGFGIGKHFCLGAALARMETRVALQAILQSASGARISPAAGALRHKPSMTIRRLQSLPIELDRTAS